MASSRTAIRWWVAAVVTAVAWLATSAPASAKRANKKRYLFKVASVKLADGVPASLATAVKNVLATKIDRHDQLLASLAADAPDPQTAPKKYQRYLARKGLRAFRVTTEITEYSTELVEQEEPRTGKVLTVRISLRLFGETIPDRSMAFAGDGAATVKIEVGRKVRERDHEVAHDDALDVAIDEAIAASIRKLQGPPPGKKHKRKK